MAEANDAPSVVVDTVVYLARSVWSVQWGWYLARAARLAGLPLALVTVPLSWAADALLVVFAPLLYAVGFLAASAQAFLSLLVSLKVHTTTAPFSRSCERNLQLTLPLATI